MALSALPIEILEARDIPHGAKLVYVSVCASPPTSIRRLAEMLGMDRDICSGHCDKLRKAGWVAIERGERGYVVRPTLPIAVQERMVKDLEERLRLGGYRGETLMRAWLEVLLDDDYYLDNFRPKYLVSPRTNKRMEYDRFHPRLRTAFEFNGFQHYRATKKLGDREALENQRIRDMAKRTISIEQGIRLIIVETKDLTLKGMLSKLKGLPLKRFDPNGPLIKALEAMSQQYINSAEAKAEAEEAALAMEHL